MGFRPLLSLTVLAVSLLLGPTVANALWTEPPAGTSAPAGNLAAPITTGGTVQTKSGSLNTIGGVSAQTGLASSAGGILGTFTGIGGTAVANSTTAGVRGESTTTTSTGGLQPGVYGLAGRNQDQTVGVYGSNGGFINAWAARFTGPTGADSTVNVYGPLTVAGTGIFGGASLNSYLDPPAVGRGPVVSASTSSRAGAVAVLGQLTNSLTNGSAIEGRTSPTVPGNCYASFAPCAGILGMTDSTSFNSSVPQSLTFTGGRFAGYFWLNLAVTGTLADSAGTFPRTYFDDRAASFVHPPQFAHLPTGSLLGVFNVGSSENKQLAVDNEGLWVGARKRIRRSDGRVLVNAAGATDGALAYDGTNLWLADRGVVPNILRRISAANGTDVQTFSLPAGTTFPANHVMFFDGTSLWALTCSSNALRLTEFTRYNSSGVAAIAIGREATVTTPSTCTEQGAVYGMERFGDRFLFVAHTPRDVKRFQYSATTSPTLQEGIQITLPKFDPTTLFDHGGSGVAVDGDEVMFRAISVTTHQEALYRVNPINFLSGGGVDLGSNHIDWIATDGQNIWGVNSAVSPAVVTITGGTGGTLILPAGSRGGQIVFDGTNFWVAGINGDTNVYKLLR
jgi:hypothetical protein